MGTANPDPEPEAPTPEDSDGQGEAGLTPDEENNASGQDSAMPATMLALSVPWPSTERTGTEAAKPLRVPLGLFDHPTATVITPDAPATAPARIVEEDPSPLNRPTPGSAAQASKADVPHPWGVLHTIPIGNQRFSDDAEQTDAPTANLSHSTDTTARQIGTSNIAAADLQLAALSPHRHGHAPGSPLIGSQMPEFFALLHETEADTAIGTHPLAEDGPDDGEVPRTPESVRLPKSITDQSITKPGTAVPASEARSHPPPDLSGDTDADLVSIRSLSATDAGDTLRPAPWQSDLITDVSSQARPGASPTLNTFLTPDGHTDIHPIVTRSEQAAPVTRHLTESAKPLPGLRDQILTALRSLDDNAIEIQLDPPELGSLRIILKTDGDLAHVRLAADRPETMELLRRSRSEFQEGLNEEGFRQVNFSFERSDSDSGESDRPAALPSDALRAEDQGLAVTADPLRPKAEGLDLRL